MRILACSDLHGDLNATQRIVAETGAADVLIVAGDLGNEGQGAEPVLAALKAAHCPVIVVAGNHDRLTDLREISRDWRDVHVLHGQSFRLRDVTFFGLGGEIPRANAALWNFSLSEAAAARELALCPANAVLITHTPPKGFVDRQPNGAHDGSVSVLETLKQKQPRLLFCGHVHASFGAEETVGNSQIFNLGPSSRKVSL